VTNTEPLLVAGRYRLVTALATGGMGVVWKGWDERLERTVAIKQLRVQPGLSPAEAAIARDRAMREARNTARLHHPHAVPVYDVVEQDGAPCLIMEFLPSISLQDAIRQRGTLPPADVARIGSEVATALNAAHRVGIVHRDVKPGNVLLAEDGTTKLTDFGISHAVGDVTLTATGMLTGTPAYLAPEVARGEPASFASDVFSLGSTLFNATEGEPPFGKDDNAMAVLHRVASGQHRMPQRSGPLTPLLSRMLTVDPTLRPSTTEVSRTLAALHVESSAADTARDKAASLETAQFRTPQVSAAPTVRAAARTVAAEPAAEPAAQTRTDLSHVSGPAPERPRRRPGLVAALLAGAVVIAAVLTAIALTRHGKSPGTGQAPQAGAKAKVSLEHSAPSAAAPTRPAAKTSQRASSSASSSGSAPGQPKGVTNAQLAQAIIDYYALMPDNLQEGWTRLTPSYQRLTSHGFDGYRKFWRQYRHVSVSNVTGQTPDTAQAIVTYVRKNGSRKADHTTFQLVLGGGQLKINRSTVP
jgi:hypothetical protein